MNGRDLVTIRATARKLEPVYAGRGAGFHSPSSYRRGSKYKPDYEACPSAALACDEDDWVDIWERD